MVYDILKAFLAGFIAAIPVGPILIMVIQKTLVGGRRSGMMAGLGSAIADSVFAAISLLTLSLVKDFMTNHEGVIMLVGGIIVALVGVSKVLKDVAYKDPEQVDDSTHVSSTIQAGSSALSNPGALAVMMAILAALGLQSDEIHAPTWSLVLVVFIGQICYWAIVTKLIVKYVRVKQTTLNRLSHIAGVIIVILAVIFIVKGIKLI